ncbi:hypothetical protein [Nocardia sp. NPDC003183]
MDDYERGYDWGAEPDVLSWDIVYREEVKARNPDESLPDDDEPDQYYESLDSRMIRLRGVIMTQSTEMELGLAQVLRFFEPEADLSKATAGGLLSRVRKVMLQSGIQEFDDDLDLLRSAVDKRNAVAHEMIRMGYSRLGPNAPMEVVISLLGAEEYDDGDLLSDLVLLREATWTTAKMLVKLQLGSQPRPRTILSRARSGPVTTPSRVG